MSEQLTILIEPKKLIKVGGAYKTIGETSLIIDVPQHVLRFWESKFPLILKPYKNKGRRYYNNQDIDLLHKIKDLLYNKGYTIKGVQGLVNNKIFDQLEKNDSISKSNISNKIEDEQFLGSLLIQLNHYKNKLRLALDNNFK